MRGNEDGEVGFEGWVGVVMLVMTMAVRVRMRRSLSG